MKCPYRRVVICSTDENGTTKSVDEFADCYEDECPYYVYWKAVAGVDPEKESCGKVINEGR